MRGLSFKKVSSISITKYPLSSAGRASPLQGGGRWFEPSSGYHMSDANGSSQTVSKVDIVRDRFTTLKEEQNTAGQQPV